MSGHEALHRHQLVRLAARGWYEVLDAGWDATARECLAYWAEHRLPLVVTRQGETTADRLALGLAAPARWQRRRIALSVARAQVAALDEFPSIDALPACSAAWQRLGLSLASIGTAARVYGSHGWQAVSGLAYVHEHSDVDVWITVGDAAQADAVAAVLHDFDARHPEPRLDGELLFADGCDFAWREWQAWRSGRARAILAKTLRGAELVKPS